MTTIAAGLDERYLLEDGRVFLTGVQALVRLVIDQRRRDRAAGLRTGAFVSGYPGSPLGSLDLSLRQAQAILSEHDILHVPAANEEMAATAITGTQMLDRYPHSKYDGVASFWYGKGPGIDRSGDALKHGNFAGTSAYGSVVLLSGEDHEAKSSTMPFQDDFAFMTHGIPVLYPSTVEEFLTLGLHAVAMSRYSGCWTAMKLVGQLCDGGETIELRADRPRITLPDLKDAKGRPWHKSAPDFTFFPGLTIETERRLHYERHAAVRAYANANGLDRVVVSAPRDRIGIVSAGKSYADLRQALADMGVTDAELSARGIRVLKIGMTYPLDPRIVREFSAPLETVIVIEEKRSFLELQVKEALAATATRVIGKFDEAERPLFPIHGAMDADQIATILGPRLLELAATRSIEARLEQLRQVRERPQIVLAARAPNYCSGCPHNVSTRLLPGELAWGSPGCHSFASVIEQPERHIEAMTQYGGEGLPWIGLAPFTDRDHMVQNVGDGSFFHSSSLNIRFAVSVGANMTFKLLFNGSIANTGGQRPTGAKSVGDTVRLLETEGVRRIALLTQEPAQYRRERFGPRTRIFAVAAQDEALHWLGADPGVTVLLYDGTCANERRRQQKRGQLPMPRRFVLINEDVCENCGHCGALTNCMSLHKVETEFGPKTQVHQSSCNQDHSCIEGDCPSFTVVTTRPGGGPARPSAPKIDPASLPAPRPRTLDGPYRIYVPGVGGTGVITVNAILAWAATLDGKWVLTFDQTGAAQKWGAVLSSLVIAPQGQRDDLHANKVGSAQADLYLALDEIGGAAPGNLAKCDPGRTTAVTNTSLLPTGEMIRNVRFRPAAEAMRTAISASSNNVLELPAQEIAERAFGDYMATNLVALGAAYQVGAIPIAEESIERAIRLNGVSVEQNIAAFRYGRLAVADPERLATSLEHAAKVTEHAAEAGPRTRSRAWEEVMRGAPDGLADELRDALATRVEELIDYQNSTYAERYVSFVADVAERERAVIGRIGPITDAVVRYHYQLLAYKDEYEVARLHLKERGRPGPSGFRDVEDVKYMLHPPFLRALGMRRKIALDSRIAVPLFRLLRGLKVLRGTPLDPFGRSHLRREERRLIGWYEGLVRDAIAGLSPRSADCVLRLATAPDLIRGYEGIKVAGIRAAEERAAALRAELASTA